MRQLFRFGLYGVPVVLAAILAFGLFILPQLAAERLAHNLKQRYSFDMAVQGSTGLSVLQGLAATLQDVTVTNPSAPGAPVARIGQITVPMPLLSLFKGGSLQHAILDDATFSFEARDAIAAAAQNKDQIAEKKQSKPFMFEVRNANLKAIDKDRGFAIAATDVSGNLTLTEDGNLAASLRGLLNGQATTVELTVDDISRMRQKGSPADIVLASSSHRVAMSGRLGTGGSLSFDGSVSAESPDVRRFLQWLGLSIQGFKSATPLAIDAGLSISKSSASFSDLAFALGEMRAKGKFAVQLANPRPNLTADLAFNDIDLNIYQSGSAAAVGARPPDLTKDWSETQFDASDLKALDADVSVTTDTLRSGAVLTGPATLKAKLANGTLAATLDSNSVYGGKASLDLVLTSATAASMSLSFDITDAEAHAILGQAFGLSALRGPVTLKADVKSNGQSPAQLISGLSGTASLIMQDGTLDGLDIAAFANVIAKNDLEGWGIAAGQTTTLASVEATATFSDGIATMTDTQLRVAGAAVTIAGNIDLLRRAVDLQAKPLGKGNAVLPVHVRATGPWHKPKFTAKFDVDEALRSVADDGVADQIEDIAKGTAKKAKKTLKKLFGN